MGGIAKSGVAEGDPSGTCGAKSGEGACVVAVTETPATGVALAAAAPDPTNAARARKSEAARALAGLR
ncbi:hypothetical protein M3C61_00540 [Dermacoccus abyssi]|uniref:hypothetical protein n=1 Tax=Dermacoccus abyssi TaxID=322596 RepID=UPI0021A78980|nr:hypothetical protein [Dermacoccus abyssi]MCT1985523.1 hypothetical protein [Dermacoccus abyssi]